MDRLRSDVMNPGYRPEEGREPGAPGWISDSGRSSAVPAGTPNQLPGLPSAEALGLDISPLRGGSVRDSRGGCEASVFGPTLSQQQGKDGAPTVYSRATKNPGVS